MSFNMLHVWTPHMLAVIICVPPSIFAAHYICWPQKFINCFFFFFLLLFSLPFLVDAERRLPTATVESATELENLHLENETNFPPILSLLKSSILVLIYILKHIAKLFNTQGFLGPFQKKKWVLS